MTELAKSAQGEKKPGEEPANAVENGGIADLPFEKALAELETIVGASSAAMFRSRNRSRSTSAVRP